MENAGGYCGKKSVRDFVERRWRSNGGWMEATGCATGAAICTCGTAPKRCGRPQVLAAYGLQDLRNKHRNPKTKSNPNTMCLPNTLGEDLGSGHFYFALTILSLALPSGHPSASQASANWRVRFRSPES